MPRFGTKQKSKAESAAGTVRIDPAVEEKIIAEITKARTISAPDLGKKYGLNIGIVKQFLRDQALKGTIQLLFKMQGIQVYSSAKGISAYNADVEKVKHRKDSKSVSEVQEEPEVKETREKKPTPKKVKPKKSKKEEKPKDAEEESTTA